MWAAIRGRWQWRYDCTTGLCWREDSWHTDGKDLNSVACCVCYFIYCFAVIWSDELSSVPTSLFKEKKRLKAWWQLKSAEKKNWSWGRVWISSYRRQTDIFLPPSIGLQWKNILLFTPYYRKFKQRPKKNCEALRNTLHPQRAPSKLNRQNYRRLMTI